jgi:hypothetical protein
MDNEESRHVYKTHTIIIVWILSRHIYKTYTIIIIWIYKKAKTDFNLVQRE